MYQTQSNFEFLDQLGGELANLDRLAESSFPQLQQQMVGVGSGLQYRHLTDLRKDCVPLEPLDEQREIVRRIETAFAKIDCLAAAAEKVLKLTDRLDQRILAKAYAGELVHQDPSDEPAINLLARIKEARATAPRSRRKKVAT